MRVLLLKGAYEEAIVLGEKFDKENSDILDDLLLHDFLMLLAEAYVYSGTHHHQAMDMIAHRLFKKYFQSSILKPASQCNLVYQLQVWASRCAYGLGDYEAIECGTIAAHVMRYREHVYDYIAMSFKAMGEWEKAIMVVKTALRYENPFNKENQERLKDMLLEYETKYERNLLSPNLSSSCIFHFSLYA